MNTIRRVSLLFCLVFTFSSFAAAQFPKVKIPKVKNPLDTAKEQNPVQRQRAGTPELVSALPDTLTSGKSSDVVITVNNCTLQDGAATSNGKKLVLPGGVEVEGYGACQNLTSVAAVAPDKIKFSLVPSSGSTSCHVAFHCPSSGYLDANFKIIDAESARRQAEMEKSQKDAIEQQKKAMGLDKANFGKVWTVTFPNGKKDIWTYVGEQSNGMAREFKNVAGEKVTMMYFNGTIQIQSGDGCVMMGNLANNRVEGGRIMQCPGMQMNDEWSATIR